MQVLAGILLLLLTGWSFYAWIAAESLQITWPRRLFAITSVILLAVVCFGGTFFLTRRSMQGDSRRQIQQLSEVLNSGLRDGRTADVHEAIRVLAEGPVDQNGWSQDILQRAEQIRVALSQNQSDRSPDRRTASGQAGNAYR